MSKLKLVAPMVTLLSPCVMLDNVNIRDADYQVWRPEYDRHAYRGIKFPQKAIGGKGGVPPSEEAEFPKPLDPVDDLPPATVITHIQQADGKRWFAAAPRTTGQ